MKKIFIIILLLFPTILSFSQSSDNEYSKEVRKEAKKYSKDGWKVFTEDNSMEKQIDDFLRMKNQNTENKSYPKYIFGYYTAKDSTLNTAKNKAKNFAMQELSSQVVTEINRVITNETTELIEGDNIQFKEKYSDVTTITSIHNLNYSTIIKFYRENPNNKEEYEVYVVLASDFLKEIEKVR